MSKFPKIRETGTRRSPWVNDLSLAECEREILCGAYELRRDVCPDAWWLGVDQVACAIETAQAMLSLYGESQLPPAIERAMLALEGALGAPSKPHKRGAFLCCSPRAAEEESPREGDSLMWAIE